jgi:L-2-hydroxycarboxylate dehydrogenase (NAD+)
MKQDMAEPYAVRVRAEDLRTFTAQLFIAAGTSEADAQLLAQLLVENDLRGSSNHGTPCVGGIGWQGYVDKMLDGTVNPRPVVQRVDDHATASKQTCSSGSQTTAVFDGDGGLGHIVCQQAIDWAVATAKSYGTAVATTRNHFHFGAAGTWTRQAVEQGCIAIAVSSHRYEPFNPEESIKAVNKTSPISMAVPAGEQPPLVLDMGASLGLKLEHLETIGARPFIKVCAGLVSNSSYKRPI